MTKHVSGSVLDVAALTALLRQVMGGLQETPLAARGLAGNTPFQNQFLVLAREYGKYEAPTGVKYLASEDVREANGFLKDLSVPPQFVSMPSDPMALGTHTSLELTLPGSKLINLDSPRGGTLPALELPPGSASFYTASGLTAVRRDSYVARFSLGRQGYLWLYQTETLPLKLADLFHNVWQLAIAGHLATASGLSHTSVQIPKFDATVFGQVDDLASLKLGVNEAGHVKRVGQVVQLATLRVRGGGSAYAERDEHNPIRFNGPMVAFTTLPARRDRVVGTMIAIPDPAAVSSR